VLLLLQQQQLTARLEAIQMVFTSQVTGTPKEKKKGKKKPNERQGQKILIINF
jgi:hypothetical protein